MTTTAASHSHHHHTPSTKDVSRIAELEEELQELRKKLERSEARLVSLKWCE